MEISLLINKQVDNAFSKKLINNCVKVISLNYKKIYSPKNIFIIAHIIKKYDLIHVHLFPSLYWVAFANLLARKPLIYTEHSTYNRRRSKWYLKLIEKWVYSRYKKIISITDSTERNLKKWIDAKENDRRFMVINNGINLQDFQNCVHQKYIPIH